MTPGQTARARLGWQLKRVLLLLRGLAFVGFRHQCPCCGWRLRAFTGKRTLLRRTTDGYCPRCNAKARHRRQWLFLGEHTDLFHQPQTLLEVAPWWSLARRFLRMPHLDYVGLDLEALGPHVTVKGDIRRCPLPSGSIDTLLCIHVLEHVAEDRQAIAELHRVLRPGGTAIVSVPLRLERQTDEDPSVTDPRERARRFGERGHLRWYGRDIVDRLENAGFVVTLFPGTALPPAAYRRHGLRDDEHVLHCRKPPLAKQPASR